MSGSGAVRSAARKAIGMRKTDGAISFAWHRSAASVAAWISSSTIHTCRALMAPGPRSLSTPRRGCTPRADLTIPLYHEAA